MPAPFKPGLTHWDAGSPVNVELLDATRQRGTIVRSFVDSDGLRVAHVLVESNDLGTIILVRTSRPGFVKQIQF